MALKLWCVVRLHFYIYVQSCYRSHCISKYFFSLLRFYSAGFQASIPHRPLQNWRKVLIKQFIYTTTPIISLRKCHSVPLIEASKQTGLAQSFPAWTTHFVFYFIFPPSANGLTIPDTKIIERKLFFLVQLM